MSDKITMENLPEHYVYSTGVIDFVTVSAQYCLLLEHVNEEERSSFVEKLVRLLPLLYLKTVLLPQAEHEQQGFCEQFVSEYEYDEIAKRTKDLMEPDDAYLETFHDDMAYSEAPILVHISENLADIYQELKNMAGNFQTGDVEVMTDAVQECMEAFEQHWGQKLLSVLRALHQLRSKPEPTGQIPAESAKQPRDTMRNAMFNYNKNQEEDVF